MCELKEQNTEKESRSDQCLLWECREVEKCFLNSRESISLGAERGTVVLHEKVWSCREALQSVAGPVLELEDSGEVC